MSQTQSTLLANPLEMWTGLAAGIFGWIGLGVYVFVPSLTPSFCSSLGPCPLRSAVSFAQPVLVAALVRLWGPLFLAVAVGAIWDGRRRALLGRVLLWLATLLLLAVTVPGLFYVSTHFSSGINYANASTGTFRGNLFFVPGIVFAVAASVAAVASRRQ